MSDCVKPVVKEPTRKWGPPSPTGGVIPFSIQGRLYRERERLAGYGMSEQEREWRAQWVRDQRLCPHEPVAVPEIYQSLYNPIRRFYRYPMDMVEKKLLCRFMGKDFATMCRVILAKSAIIIAGVYCTAYYFKYNSNDWTSKSGWYVRTSRRSVLPGDPGWPYQSERTVGADYADRGFKNSPIQKPVTASAESSHPHHGDRENDMDEPNETPAHLIQTTESTTSEVSELDRGPKSKPSNERIE